MSGPGALIASVSGSGECPALVCRGGAFGNEDRPEAERMP